MTRAFKDWGGNIAAFVVVIVMNFLANALPINGQTMPEISAKYPSLFTPAGFTFSIWGVIYLTLLVFVFYQALPGQRQNQSIASISGLFQINCILNAVWIMAWHYDLLVISVLLMIAILSTLILIYRRLRGASILLRLPFSLYTGWITVATIANLSVLQISRGWDDVGLSAIEWTLLKLAVAGSVGAAMVIKGRDIAFGLVIAWAAFGISVMQQATPSVAGGAMTLCLIALLLAAAEACRKVVRR